RASGNPSLPPRRGRELSRSVSGPPNRPSRPPQADRSPVGVLAGWPRVDRVRKSPAPAGVPLDRSGWLAKTQARRAKLVFDGAVIQGLEGLEILNHRAPLLFRQLVAKGMAGVA